MLHKSSPDAEYVLGLRVRGEIRRPSRGLGLTADHLSVPSFTEDLHCLHSRARKRAQDCNIMPVASMKKRPQTPFAKLRKQIPWAARPFMPIRRLDRMYARAMAQTGAQE